MASTLLQTKLYIPALRENLVSRSRLVARLNQVSEPGHKLTLVCAPAGYGKTTLVAEWLHHTDLPAAWLSLDEQDNDPARFQDYFLAALQEIDASWGETANALRHAPQPPPPEIILTALINEIAAAPTPFMLALDDYHLIQDEAIHQQLAFILEHQPPHMHLTIITRDDPPLPVFRWRARGQLTELRQSDLSFSTAETADYLQRVMGLNLSPGDIAALERRSEGWIAGLQLAALSMRGRSDLPDFIRAFTGSNRYVLDYLMEEVFRQQPAGRQDFLLQTAILDRLCAPLCDSVTGRADSRAVLQRLEQANLFIVPLDQSRQWYRYHHLFRELLRHRLRRSDQFSAAALHQKAARWYEAQGIMSEAVKHALATENWPEAGRVVALAAENVVQRGQIATLLGWLNALPEQMISQNYELATTKGWVLFMTGQSEAAAEFATVAETLIPADALANDRATLLVLRSSLALVQFDIANAVELAQKALALMDSSDSFFMRGLALNNMAQVQMVMGDMPAATAIYREIVRLGQDEGYSPASASASANLAMLLHQQGKRREAVVLCQQTLDQCVDSRGRPLPLAGYAHVTMSLLCSEANQLEPAHQHLLQGLQHGEQLGMATGIPTSGKIMLAQLQQAMGAEQAALATISEARQMGVQSNSPMIVAAAAGAEADILLKQGNLLAAERWAETAGLSPTGPVSPLREADTFTLARLLIAQNRLMEAGTLLDNFEQFARQGGRHRSLLTVTILQALVQQGLGHKEQARARLESALSLAAPEDYRRAFLDEGRPVLDLLPAVRHVAPDFVDQVLLDDQTAPGREPPPPPTPPLLDPLSKREQEVLQLLAAGLSNREIAEELVISVGTVKTHVHHIYGKLDVRDRPQAIVRAQELNLA
jgi:LuxR family maltose regulon positive regulatory protein